MSRIDIFPLQSKCHGVFLVFVLAIIQVFQGISFPKSSFEVYALIRDLYIILGMLICIGIKWTVKYKWRTILHNISVAYNVRVMWGNICILLCCKWTYRPDLNLLYSFKKWMKEFTEKPHGSLIMFWKYIVCHTSLGNRMQKWFIWQGISL